MKNNSEKEQVLNGNETGSDGEHQSIKERINEIKNQGNHYFQLKQYEESIEKYTEALKICPVEYNKELSILYGNRAAAKNLLNHYESALDDCNKALELDDSYKKVILRRAHLNEKLEKLDESLQDFEKILTIEPNQKEAMAGIKRLKPKIEERNENLKLDALDKLKSLGNLVLKPFGLSTDNFVVTPNAEGGCSINFKQK